MLREEKQEMEIETTNSNVNTSLDTAVTATQ